jgi:antitoxin HicB
MKRKNPHWGSTLVSWLDEEGFRKTARSEAVTRVVAWQLAQEMKRKGLTKARLASQMKTSRAQIDRILKANGNVTIDTLKRAAALVGRKLHVELR